MNVSYLQKTIPVGPLQCNCQLLVCRQTQEAVLIDPGDEPELILSTIKKAEIELGSPIKLKALLHTHAHFDHIGATRKVKEFFADAFQKNSVTQIPSIYLHPDDLFIYQNLKAMSIRYGMTADDPLPVDFSIEDEQEFQFGELKLKTLHTPGHSPGSVCFHLQAHEAQKVPEVVFTGDTLFRENIGRADLWGGDEDVLVRSIQRRLFTLDSDAIAWPGHGPSSTVGHEQRHNPYVKP